MTKKELLAKCDEAIAACLDQVVSRAKGQESNNACTFATAAQTVQMMRMSINDQTERTAN